MSWVQIPLDPLYYLIQNDIEFGKKSGIFIKITSGRN